MLIEDYFREIQGAIEESPFVAQSEIFKDKRSLHIAFIEGKVFFQDDSSLHLMEFVDVREEIVKYKYRYHYQDKDGVRIFRYDMAPHHRHISTFPHHKHVGSEASPNNVVESDEPSLRGVIKEIELLYY